MLSLRVVRALSPSAPLASLRRCAASSAAAPSPPPKQTVGALLTSLPGRYFALIKEHGPAGLLCWSSLYVGQGLAAYAHLRAMDNYGWDVPSAVAALPDAAREWAEYLLAQGSGATGLDVAALQPWHTSAALAWLSAEATEPLRLLLTLAVLRALQLRRSARAAATAAAAVAALPAAVATAASPKPAAAALSSQPPQRPMR